MTRYFRCVKSWRSQAFPDIDYGETGKVYQLQEPDGIYDGEPFINGYYYVKLIGLGEGVLFHRSGFREWLNSERFEEVININGNGSD